MSEASTSPKVQQATLTAYHAQYLSQELTRQHPSDDPGRFTASLQDAQVDLNMH